jgi:hypothetical protein
MSEIKLFPIGDVATTNSTSKGAWVSGGTEENLMFEPNFGCGKDKKGYSAVSNMENRAIQTRKIGEMRHTLDYKYKDIWNWEFKKIRRFMRDISEYKVNSFYLIDFSSGQQITALATGATWNASIYDTTDFSATAGEGGKYACIWYPRISKFRIGALTSKVEDSSITFSDTGDYGDLNQFVQGDVYAYPMYRVYLNQDQEKFKIRAHVDANLNASFAGPVRSGNVRFIQRDIR